MVLQAFGLPGFCAVAGGQAVMLYYLLAVEVPAGGEVVVISPTITNDLQTP